MGLYRRGAVWWIEYFDGAGSRHRVSLKVTDKKLAEIAVGDLRRAIEAGQVGAKNFDATKRLRPLELAAEYLEELERRGCGAVHRATIDRRIRRLLEGAARLDNVTTESVRQRLRALARDLKLGPASVNFHRTALYGFFAWLVREGRWLTNPVEAVPRVTVVGVSRERRALSDAERSRLLATAPPDRAAVYRLALVTGLRRSELRSLRWAQFRPETLTLTLPAASAKNREAAVFMLDKGTVDVLLALRGDAGPEAKVFLRKNGRSSVPRMQTFEEDLARAEIDRGEPATGVVDFHALRVSFISSLARAGVPLAHAQKLARHSTPMLTANVYTRFEVADSRAAIAKIAPGSPAEGASPTVGGIVGGKRRKGAGTR